MRRALPLALLLTSLLGAQAPAIPELKPAMVLAVGERVLESWAPLLVAPERSSVAVLGADGLQMWDGRSGAVLRSTLPRPLPPPPPSPTEEGTYIVDGTSGCGGRTFSGPPPIWNELEGRFMVIDWDQRRSVTMKDGALVRQAVPAGAVAAGPDCILRHEGANRLRVVFGTGPDWILEPRRADNAPDEGVLGERRFSLVALAQDGSEVAAFWHELTRAGETFIPSPGVPPHLLIWRRGDRLPSLDLVWEGREPASLEFSPGGHSILAWTTQEFLLLDPVTGRERAVIPSLFPPTCWVPGHDQALFQIDPDTRTFALWDLEWGEELSRFSLPQTLTIDGDRVVEGAQGPATYLMDPQAMSPDGHWVAAIRTSAPSWRATEVVLFELGS